MAESKLKSYPGMPEVEDPVKERDDWLGLLNELVQDVNGWVQQEWATRVITTTKDEPPIGEYEAPVLLLQRELVRLAMVPVTRFARGTDGVVELYRMPRFDGVASICRIDGEWRIHFAFPGEKASVAIRDMTRLELTRDNVLRVIDGIFHHAS